MKFGFFTLGCKVNQYETQAMEQLLKEMGHSIGSFDEACDGYIINTCSVTAVADKKNRAVIRRCRKSHPDAIIGVCGCYTQHAPDAARKLGVDVLGGSGGREAFLHRMLLACANLLPGEKVPPTGADEGSDKIRGAVPSSVTADAATASPQGEAPEIDNALRRRVFEVLPAGGLEARTRAMLKVQDGCVNFCTYCIIPYTRGPVRSAPLELAVEQTRTLVAEGYREIVVTGIEIASWGADLPGKPRLEELLEAVCAAAPACRIRLGSLEPRVITEEFCQRIAQLPNICPQFHLSLQSGSDSVLARMKRKYDTQRYLESVQLLNTYFPGCAVTTDMIVAFPGETEAEFAESLAFIRKCAFADMHIFPYSRRPGTPADKMPGQHDNATKEARSRAAIAVAREMSEAYRQALIGSTQSVLFEEAEGAFYTGHAPNYVKVYAPGTELHNQVKDVRILSVYEDGVMGEIA